MCFVKISFRAVQQMCVLVVIRPMNTNSYLCFSVIGEIVIVSHHLHYRLGTDAKGYRLFPVRAGIMGSKLRDVTDCNQLLPVNLRPCHESKFGSLKCLSVSLIK